MGLDDSDRMGVAGFSSHELMLCVCAGETGAGCMRVLWVLCRFLRDVCGCGWCVEKTTSGWSGVYIYNYGLPLAFIKVWLGQKKLNWRAYTPLQEHVRNSKPGYFVCVHAASSLFVHNTCTLGILGDTSCFPYQCPMTERYVPRKTLSWVCLTPV